MPPVNGFWDRRDFLKLMGSSMALAALSGCRNRMPAEEILAYNEQPENLLLGRSKFYASTFPMGRFTQGVLVESHEGRPTKIEGNPRHPASLGATSYFAQAATMDLYSPYRLRGPKLAGGKPGDWGSFREFFAARSGEHLAHDGAGLAILSAPIVSPTLRAQVEDLRKIMPACTWHTFEPSHRDFEFEGLARVFGQPAEAIFDFTNAERVLSIDHDFLLTEPNAVANARAYSLARRERRARLYTIEPSLSATGTKADRRWAVKSSAIPQVLLRLEAAVEAQLSGAPKSGPKSAFGSESGAEADWSRIAQDLVFHKGRSLLLAGSTQAPVVHEVIHRLNAKLGNEGKTVFYRPPLHESFAGQTNSLEQLCQKMNRGEVKTLVLLGGNPVFDAPVDFNFLKAFGKVETRIHLTAAENETSNVCHWVLPRAHFLESWSDAESHDGSVSLVQPLIAPLYQSVTDHDLLHWLSGGRESGSYNIVRTHWQKRWPRQEFERNWREALKTGLLPVSTSKAPMRISQSISSEETISAARRSADELDSSSETLELELRPDPTVWDGGQADNPWLQELPKPPTQLTWDNALLLSPARAGKLKVQSGDFVRLEVAGQVVRAPAFIVEGLPDDSLTLHFGYGRRTGGPVAEARGFDAFPLRTSRNPWQVRLDKIEKAEGRYDLACTQTHHDMGERETLRTVNGSELEHLKPLTGDAPEKEEEKERDIGRGAPTALTEPSLHNEAEQWALSIDLDSCTGCSACVIACQAENNVPSVGKTEVLNGREMHWIRIDRYDSKAAEGTLLSPQPVTCMHCEKAPCEVVCPVAATNHSDDGLNLMVYNRCVGTRYCSNNCPYKVRRFNFYRYGDWTHETAKFAKNPEVTVRDRGVMEKCTYCVQRIQRARIESRKANRPIRDGEIVTACAQVCPAEAIVFGNLLDPAGLINTRRRDPRTYGLLTELGTRPRTTYLARVSNSSADSGEKS